MDHEILLSACRQSLFFSVLVSWFRHEANGSETTRRSALIAFAGMHRACHISLCLEGRLLWRLTPHPLCIGSAESTLYCELLPGVLLHRSCSIRISFYCRESAPSGNYILCADTSTDTGNSYASISAGMSSSSRRLRRWMWRIAGGSPTVCKMRNALSLQTV